MYPHRIRLRGPWEYQAGVMVGRIALPLALRETPLAAHEGAIRFSRRFGYPGRIDPVERVWLVIESLAVRGILTLNDSRIGECESNGEWDITERLGPRNELVIETSATSGVPWSEVAMEVRRSAFLRRVRIWATGNVVHATGEVMGQADGPLELYLVADRRNVAYGTLTASEEGTAFSLSGECVDGLPSWAKLELVQGSVAWYTKEVEFGPGSA